jgi:signal transduction histidine kinase
MLFFVSAGRRALWVVFPAAAVLASAVGIAYLGAVSYLADRGMVAAKSEEQAVLARRVAEGVTAEIRIALDAAAAALETGDGEEEEEVDRLALDRLAAAHPSASQPFYLDRDGNLVYPPQQAGDGSVDSAPDEEFMALLSRSARMDPKRAAQLTAARKREESICAHAGPGATEGPCRADTPTEHDLSTRRVWEARRAYAPLARFADTGPEALLGLARIERVAVRPAQAAELYRELDRRFGKRVDSEGIPYAFLAALGLADVTGDSTPLLEALRRLLSGEYALPRAAHGFLVETLRSELQRRPLASAAAEIADIDRTLAAARDAGRLAARLSEDLAQLARTSEPEARGRPAFGAPDRVLIHRRLPSGGVVGFALERADLGLLAERATPASERERGLGAAVLPFGESPDSSQRSLASASFGPLLPHLSLVLVQDRSRPDPVEEVVRQRGRRHLFLTGGLVAVLVLGLFATIRGAAKERELARLKSDFVSTVSHELKTPLTSIRMFAEMLQQGVAGEDREREQRYHEIIVKESERLGLLIANLLDYAQIERGTRRYNRKLEPAGQLAQEAVTTFARLREGEGQEVQLSAADPAPILVDREVTVQALLNLLSNAAKYGGAGGHPVEVAVARRADGRVAMSVSDHGPGIPRAEHERIFREFYRAPAAYTAGVEGTGLGLALVKRHIEAQGGAIELDSEPGRGATFTLVFPDASAAESASPPP